MNFLFYVPQMAAYGGIERHVCVLAEEAAKRGHHVRFLTTSNSLNEGARKQLKAYGVDFREMAASRENAGAVQKLLWLGRQTLSARLKHWDVIYTNGQSGFSRIVWQAARKKTRIIHHHHTAADADEQKTWAPAFWHVLQRSPEVVGCSETTRQNIQQAIGRKDVRFLPYFTACPVEADQVVERTYAANQPLHFGFVGRLIATKGIDTLCELSTRPELRGITWHLHGASPEFPPSHFEAYPTIRYYGPYRDMTRYGEILRDLDAIVLFSKHNEGMPLSLIESMSAGLPWVASDRGGTRELALSRENCVLVDNPRDVNAVLACTLELAGRIRGGRTSRQAQRRVYDENFAPTVVAQRWFEFLEGNSAPDDSLRPTEPARVAHPV